VVSARFAPSWSPKQTAAAAPPRDLKPVQDSFLRLEQAEQLRQQGKLDRAQRICESLVREYPDYMAAQHTLGLVLADQNNYGRALNHLMRAAMLNPRSWNTLTALSGVCLSLGAREMAAQMLEQAKRLKPHDANVLVTLGEIYGEEREYELAREAYREAFTLEPSLVPAGLGFAQYCAELGEHEQAAKIAEGMIEKGLRLLEPVQMLAHLPPSVVSVDVVGKLEAVVRDPNEDQAEFDNVAAFARATAYDKVARHAEAWRLLVEANRTMHLAMQEQLRDVRKREAISLAALQAAPGKSGRNEDAAQPVSLFILGPSRSGKTTMEALVGTLPKVKRGYENPSVENAVRRAFQTGALLSSAFIEGLPPQLYSLCREIYLEELARRAGSAKVFTNTHPQRVHDAARILTVFPNVRFIFMKRDIDDNSLRIYMRRYRTGNAYAYDLGTTREHIRWYHDMIDLMAQKFPDIVRVINYEDMVADPAAALRTAAEICGLPMNDEPLPPIGEDRGCAEPYREFMAAS
jgi:tetratricopeptide (TPR) repeat protein